MNARQKEKKKSEFWKRNAQISLMYFAYSFYLLFITILTFTLKQLISNFKKKSPHIHWRAAWMDLLKYLLMQTSQIIDI